MRVSYGVLEKTPEELAQLEWAIDYDLVIPRQEMCDLMALLCSHGKEVYIVSDTFYTKDQLARLLEKCGFTCYTGIFASCEYKTDKTRQLFEIVKSSISGRKCIHIGDDPVADIESAKKHGIAACQIYSGMELMEYVGYLGLWDSIEGLADRIKAGMFVSRLFNSPFQFEIRGQKISVTDAYDIGYLFLAPMITDFVMWFYEQVEKHAIGNVWFCARDGYLIKKLYDKLVKNDKSVYFLTSRTAAIRAGIQSKKDIEYVEKMKFSGSIRLQMKERFGITIGIDEVKEEQNSLQQFSKMILHRSAQAKEHYLRYIEQLRIQEGEIAFFDFVAKGTTQMFVEKMVQNHMKGLYFLQLEKESMQGLDVLSFYDTQDKDNSAIFENYYVLETIITSPEPSVTDFDDSGHACYAKETRRKEDIKCFLEVQRGILEYFDTYLQFCSVGNRVVNKKMDEIFLNLIHGIHIQNPDFISLQVEDPFYNRVTEMKDLI